MNENVTLIVKSFIFAVYKIDFFSLCICREVYPWDGLVCFQRSWQISAHVWMIKFIQCVAHAKVHTQMSSASPSLSLIFFHSLLWIFAAGWTTWHAQQRWQPKPPHLNPNSCVHGADTPVWWERLTALERGSVVVDVRQDDRECGGGRVTAAEAQHVLHLDHHQVLVSSFPVQVRPRCHNNPWRGI